MYIARGCGCLQNLGTFEREFEANVRSEFAPSPQLAHWNSGMPIRDTDRNSQDLKHELRIRENKHIFAQRLTSDTISMSVELTVSYR